MQKYAVVYVKYAELYILHILHLYALPTLLMDKQTGFKLVSLCRVMSMQRLSSPGQCGRDFLTFSNLNFLRRRENLAQFYKPFSLPESR